MSKVAEILAALELGIPPRELAQQVNWETLQEGEADQLLDEARRMGAHPLAYQLLMLLYLISKEDEYTVRVLGYAAQHPALSAENRQNTLRTMRRALDRSRARIEAAPDAAEHLPMQQLYEAAYFALNAQVLEAAGDGEKALQNFESAHAIYQSLGYGLAAERVGLEVERLRRELARLRLEQAAAPVQPRPRPSGPPLEPPPPPEEDDASLQPLPGPSVRQPLRPAALRRSPPAVEETPAGEAEDERMALLAELESEIQAQTARRDALAREIASLEQRQQQSARRPAVQPRPALAADENLHRQVEQLQQQLEEERAAYEELEQKVNSQPDLERIDGLAVQRGNLANEVSELKRQLKELRRELETLSAERDDLEAEIADLQRERDRQTGKDAGQSRGKGKSD